MGVIKLTKLAGTGVDNVGGRASRPGVARAWTPKAGHSAPGAWPAVRPSPLRSWSPRVSSDSPVEECEAQYFCPLLGSDVVGEYRLVSSDITRCHIFARAALKRRKTTAQCATHT
jgi:hypothetical protein